MNDLSTVNPIKDSKKANFRRNLLLFICFSLPTAYIAIIAAVTAHEVLGHGLSALIFGGNFLGFIILPDAMGAAYIDLGAVLPASQAAVLFAGALVTTVLAAIFFILSVRLKRRFALSLTLLFFALAFLMDGVPYFFWDAIYLGGIGDVSCILSLYPSDLLRTAIIVISGILLVGGIALFNYLFVKQFSARLSSEEGSKLSERVAVTVVALAVQLLGWLSFDWRQLIPIPKAAVLPTVIPVLLTILLAGISMFFVKPTSLSEKAPALRWKTPIITAWSACIALALVTVLWLQYGVLF